MADNWKRFWIVSAANGKLEVSSFAINRDLQPVCGAPKNVKRLRSGDLLIEVSSEEQSKKLAKLYNIGNTAVKVEPHRSLNTSKCVVTNREFIFCSTEELVAEFQGIGVTEARKLGDKGTVLLTFGKPTYPSDVKFFYQRIRTREYLPNPLRCYKCNRFGHTSRGCRSEETCQICSQSGHSRDQCKNAKLCINCKGDHDAGSRSCPTFKHEKRVIEIKFREKLSFPEARKKAAKKTYSEVAASSPPKPKKFSNASCQTEPEIIEIPDAKSPATQQKKAEKPESLTPRKRKPSTESSTSKQRHSAGSTSSSQRPRSVVAPPYKHQRR